MKILPIALLSLCVFGLPAAYAQIGTANLAGTVRDDAGNPLPGSTVLAKNIATGLERSDTTGEAGSYRIPSLPFGTYDVSAQIQGFATLVQKDIRLDVGRTASVEFNLKLSTLGQTIEVSGEPPLIAKNESHVSSVVAPEQIQNLPVKGRQLAELAALAPGTSVALIQDPTRPNSLYVGLNGGSGRNVKVTVDGGDNNDDVIGYMNQAYSFESIAEFTFLTNRFSAEYGRTSGGVINVVTKSGSNEFHGSFFTLFRDKAFNSVRQADKAEGLTESPYRRSQFGGSLGGPVVKDKAHFFISAESERLNIPTLVDTRGIEPEMDGAHNVPTRNQLYCAKFTANLDPKQFLMVRYGQQKFGTFYNAFDYYAPNAWSTLDNEFHSLLASYNLIPGIDKLNELIFQYADYRNDITPMSNDPIEIFLSNGRVIGQNPNFPQSNEQVKYELRDSYSWNSTIWKGSHHFKSGIGFIHEPVLGGSALMGQSPYRYFYDGEDRSAPIIGILKVGGVFEYQTPNNQFAIFIQDDWTINNHLTFNLGVRYDYVTGFDLDQSGNPLYQALLDVPYDFPWLRSVKENPSGKLSNDTNNIAPRIGFAWDWKGEGRRVIRGGWGIYYDFPYTNANVLWPTVALNGFGDEYLFWRDSGILNANDTLFRIGDPLPANELSRSITPGEVASPDFVVPYSFQYSLGFSTLIGKSAAMDVDYVHSAVHDQYVRFRFNGLIEGEKLLKDFGNARFWYNGGFSTYDALNISYRQAVSKRVELQAIYTLSKVTGNTLLGANEFILGGVPGWVCKDCTLDFKSGPRDDPRMTGPLDTDQRHRFVAAGFLSLPLDFSMSGFFTAASAPPYNAFLPEDPDLDGFPYSIEDPYVNYRRAASFWKLDLRIAKVIHAKAVQIEAILEVFNILNATNPGGFVADQNAEDFGQPTGFAEPRAAQLGFSIEF